MSDRGLMAARTTRAIVLRCICNSPIGRTDDEGECETGLLHQQYSPRRCELAQEGLIVAVGMRRTNSGKMAQVWKCTGKANVPRSEERRGG